MLIQCHEWSSAMCNYFHSPVIPSLLKRLDYSLNVKAFYQKPRAQNKCTYCKWLPQVQKASHVCNKCKYDLQYDLVEQCLIRLARLFHLDNVCRYISCVPRNSSSFIIFITTTSYFVILKVFPQELRDVSHYYFENIILIS